MAAVPGPVYGLEVPPGEVLIPANLEFPASFRITMAALDPTQEPELDDSKNAPSVPRSTLRLIKRAFPGLDEDEDDELDDEYMSALLGNSDDEDDEANGGPSDPAKAKKQKQAAAIKKLLEATNGEDSEDEEMEDAETNGVKGKKGKSNAGAKGKGKGKAIEEEEEDEDEEDEDDEDDESEGGDLENFVLCTLDTERNYQQPLDITVNQGEKVFFVVSGTHTVYLTGNYIMDDEEEGEEGEDDYDLSPDELEYAMGEEDSEEESDDLDDLADPRVTEVDSDEEEVPKLVPTDSKKGKNKRSAAEAEGLDELISKAADSKLSKKQQKKLKNNKGEAVAAEEKKDAKKVQFAKNLEQGPTGSTAEKAKQAGKASLGVKNVSGVTVDDRTVGKGRTVKSGDTVGVRYIGKLANGQQFDANKKGKPFSFKIGKGQVIKGWDIGIMGMAIGGERRLTIPAHLAYGSKSLPGIPANSQLTFDVKLLEIK